MLLHKHYLPNYKAVSMHLTVTNSSFLLQISSTDYPTSWVPRKYMFARTTDFVHCNSLGTQSLSPVTLHRPAAWISLDYHYANSMLIAAFPVPNYHSSFFVTQLNIMIQKDFN